MYGNYQYLSQLRNQARNYDKGGDGQKLIEFNDEKDLIPFENSGGMLSFIGWGSGKRSVKQVHDLQSACLEVARKADDYADKLGLRDRITQHLEELDWTSMTLKELADELDVMLGSSSVQLLKAQGAVDTLIEHCKAFAEQRWTGTGMEQRFADAAQTLTEAFKEFDSAEGGSSHENLEQFKQTLNQSVTNAYQTMGGHPNHENDKTIVFLANEIHELFQNFTTTLEAQTDNVAFIPPEPPTPNSEAGIFIRLTEMLSDLKNPDKHGKGLNDSIRSLAKDTVELIDNCKDAEGMLVKVREACDEELAGILKKDADLRLSIELFTKPLDDIELLVRSPVPAQPLEYIPPAPATSTQKPAQPHYKTVSDTPPQAPSISGEELHQAGLVHNQNEYNDLCRIMGHQFMQWPGVKPRLEAFRHLQRFNPGFTNQEFNTLMIHMGSQNIETWMNSMNQFAQSGHYNSLLEHVEFAVSVAAKQRQVTPEVLEVLPYLTMNGLSGSNLLSQLSALTMLAQSLGRNALTAQEMAIAINHNLLTDLIIQHINDAWQSPQKLAQLNQSLVDEVQHRRAFNKQKREDYQREDIYNTLEKRFSLAPHPVPANGDCLFSAVGHLMAEPMRKVRERCHWAAKDILDMKIGQFSLDPHTPYAGRITQAANTFNDEQLQALAQRVAHKNLLTPVFEQTNQQAGWGTDDDLALVALAYDIPVVPIAPENGLQDMFGFKPNGEMLWSNDTQGAARDLTGETGKPPIMLICHNKHWEPLVARR